MGGTLPHRSPELLLCCGLRTAGGEMHSCFLVLGWEGPKRGVWKVEAAIGSWGMEEEDASTLQIIAILILLSKEC